MGDALLSSENPLQVSASPVKEIHNSGVLASSMFLLPTIPTSSNGSITAAGDPHEHSNPDEDET